MTHESTAAWRELLDTLSGLDRSFLEGDRAVTDDRHIADGYRMLATTLGVAFDTYLFAEPSRPMFVEVNTPFRRDRRWGGDNTDAYYCICPIDPKRRYRISGNRGDSVYFSLTAYNEPSPARGRTGSWRSCATTISTSTTKPVSYETVRGVGFYRQFLSTRDWADFMRAGRVKARHALAVSHRDARRAPA